MSQTILTLNKQFSWTLIFATPFFKIKYKVLYKMCKKKVAIAQITKIRSLKLLPFIVYWAHKEENCTFFIIIIDTFLYFLGMESSLDKMLLLLKQ